MAAKAPEQKQHDKLILTIWLIAGVALVALNYFSFGFIAAASQLEVMGWLNLFGGSIYLLAGLMMLFTLDALYVLLLLRWIFFSRKHRGKDSTLYLP